MNVLVVIVNYNGSKVTQKCIESILFPAGIYGEICVVDNKSDNENINILKDIDISNVNIIYSDNNLGYFQGINFGLKEYEVEKYDYIIIGNNDLVFTDDFFKKLYKKQYGCEYFVIAPNIITIDSVHQNPHEIKKISDYRLLMYRIYFSNYYIGCIMYIVRQTIKRILKKKNRVKCWEKSSDIFLGYGAAYILTKSFFKVHKKLDYPFFLMGEEAYLSYQVHNYGGKMLYDSSIIIKHLEHSSVSKIKNKRMYEITKKSYLGYGKILKKIKF